MKKLMTVIVAVFVFTASGALAIQLAVGDPPQTGGYVYSGEARPIVYPSTTVGILEQGSGQPALDSLMLIIGIPNVDSRYSAPIVQSVSPQGSASSPIFGSLLTSGEEVYSDLGLAGGNNSNKFAFWAAADLAIDKIAVTQFALFKYNLTGTGISGGKTVDVDFSFLPMGTFVVAYGLSGTKAFSTPVTEAGLVVPEPSSLVLIGFGLLGLAGISRKSKK